MTEHEKVHVICENLCLEEGMTKEQIENLNDITNRRIDNIIVSGEETEGNTELIDIRTGYDGRVYSTAGKAVRKQVSELGEDLNEIFLDKGSEIIVNGQTFTSNAEGSSSTGSWYGFATRIQNNDKFDSIEIYYDTVENCTLTCCIRNVSFEVLETASKNVNAGHGYITFDFPKTHILDSEIYVSLESDKKSLTNSMETGVNITNFVTADNRTDNKGNYFNSNGSWAQIKNAQNEKTFSMYFKVKKIKYNKEIDYDLMPSKVVSKLDEIYKMNYLYVATNGSDVTGDGTENNPYASIYHANEVITDNTSKNRYTIIVKPGTYTDLQERYAGTYSGYYEGVITKDYVYYESTDILHPERTIIEWDGLYGFNEPYINDMVVDKSPFHISYSHTHIKGFYIKGRNLRYPIHVELAGVKGYNCDFVVSNLLIDWHGKIDIPTSRSIDSGAFGMGTAHFLKGLIKDCKINLLDGMRKCVYIHDNAWKETQPPFMYKGCEITFENCIFVGTTNNKDVLVQTIRENNPYDTNNLITFKNCIGIDKYHSQISSPALVNNWNYHLIATEIPTIEEDEPTE